MNHIKIKIGDKQAVADITKELDRIGKWWKLSGYFVFAWDGIGNQNILHFDKIPMGHYVVLTLCELIEIYG